ncbi:SIS domain-containing protein [Nitratireductor sp. CAU 1489]|uniref:SIS domain-containing protein n=1 Tax=Nitratireductor arenosus TaxID=2682096 RepID=A0A844QFE4_9HYPH|nr:MurR/RpiR family transcriptional regulator [Nitratireductor arenosus]MVA96740.1 SIS domain-containing protein [Nitratireductor arenosus]
MNDVFSRISKIYPSLKKAERRIADLILADADFFLRGSITEVAQAAGVSASSLTRFSRHLEVEGFRELKLSVAQAKSAQSPYYHQSVQALNEIEIAEGRLEYLYLQQIVAALNSTFTRLDAEALVDAIRAIRSARRIRTFGVAVSGLIASETAMRFMRLGLEASYVGDAHFMRIASSLLGAGDVAICISHTGRSQEVLEAADMARRQGAQVVGLTAPHTPLSRKADILLELSVFEEIDIYTPSISHFAYHYVIGLLAFHIGQSSDLDRDALLAKIKAGLAPGQSAEPAQ